MACQGASASFSKFRPRAGENDCNISEPSTTALQHRDKCDGQAESRKRNDSGDIVLYVRTLCTCELRVVGHTVQYRCLPSPSSNFHSGLVSLCVYIVVLQLERLAGLVHVNRFSPSVDPGVPFILSVVVRPT